MREERFITIDGQQYSVMISDEQEALLAAQAAGGALVGLWNKNCPEQNLTPAEYVVESLEDVTGEFLERVVLRKLGQPWVICETDRLILREFEISDVSQLIKETKRRNYTQFTGKLESPDSQGDAVFCKEDLLQAYIDSQYRFYEYGIWALVEKDSGILIGKAGLFNGDNLPEEGLEIGYHVFRPYRRQGYAYEACEAILRYAADYLSVSPVSADTRKVGKSDFLPLYAKIDPSNEASIHLAKKSGFVLTAQKCTGSAGCHDLYVWSCSQFQEE